MKYAQWQNGKIVGDCKWPNRLTDQTPVDENSPEWIEYLNRQPEKKIDIKLTESEKIKLIDFYQLHRVITADRATELKG